MNRKKILLLIWTLLTSSVLVLAQRNPTPLWHNKEREVRYAPDGEDFIIKNGERRFNRALYGSNTGFRVEAGDLPKFALYLPGMGGTLRFGFIAADSSKWLIHADKIHARYHAGSMSYEVTDPLLDGATLHLTVYASSDRDGILVRTILVNTQKSVELITAFGGATGKRFSRDGDIGADPESSFYLKPEYCVDNRYALSGNGFHLHYGSGKSLTNSTPKILSGWFPSQANVKVADATKQDSPQEFVASKESATPAIAASISMKPGQEYFFAIHASDSTTRINSYSELPLLLMRAEESGKNLAARVKFITPDPHLNTLGPALSVAADAIWEHPSYLHGAVAWRMRLNAWRGAYVADPLGWHERARTHFSAYAQSQLTAPDVGPLAPDTTLHFARHTEKLGNAMFSNGYICRNPGGEFRAHHYDMNLVFIDQLLLHFDWTGDLNYVREMWPVIKRHLAWEKRNFDHDDDGLYDAYCCIWASDALQYSNGGVTHSSAYNYRANAVAAELAQLVGEDPLPYKDEAQKIHAAMQRNLWMDGLGGYAEYKDFLGKKLQHPSAGLWTIYHAIDADVPDDFQKYQSLRYVDTHIPHIPIKAKGLADDGYYTLSTTNWQPYTWSVNNVALAEVLHTALAYWQGGRSEEAFRLWKGALLESMYLSASPGGFEQLSFYDAIRGELYRDFADPIGMAGRSLIEGLFGIRPQALKDTLTIHPGFPTSWDHASLTIPDLKFDFRRTHHIDEYTIIPTFATNMNLVFQVPAHHDAIKSMTINNESTPWRIVSHSIGSPVIEAKAKKAAKYVIRIEWSDTELSQATYSATQIQGKAFIADVHKAKILAVHDPQCVLTETKITENRVSGMVTGADGFKTVFLKVRQKNMEWWLPLDFEVKQQITFTPNSRTQNKFTGVTIQNNGEKIRGSLMVNPGRSNFQTNFTLNAGESKNITVNEKHIVPGTNVVRITTNNDHNDKIFTGRIINWSVPRTGTSQRSIDLTPYFNDALTNIFKNKYLSPRPASPTLQLPWQGIGNWCYPLVEPVIDDTGIRTLAGDKNSFTIPQGISFATPSRALRNILFTSQWDNYPDSVTIPLSGNASHIYFLMAGSTNPMQSRFVNGLITIRYVDGTESQLELKNPETWWPIEQDYYVDGFAFRTDAPKPIRVHLKTGLITQEFKAYTSIKGFSNFAIDGGAATVLDLPLDASRPLKSLTVKAIANDVVIGLMSATLVSEH